MIGKFWFVHMTDQLNTAKPFSKPLLIKKCLDYRVIYELIDKDLSFLIGPLFEHENLI